MYTLIAYAHQLWSFYPREVVSGVLATATCLGGWVSVTCRYCIKTSKHIWKLFRPSESPIILVSREPCADTLFQGEPIQRPVNYTMGAKNWWFSTDIAVYLGNGARQADGYYGTLIGNHGCRIEWYHFRWPWVTPNPGFKVTVYWQVEYLQNGAY